MFSVVLLAATAQMVKLRPLAKDAPTKLGFFWPRGMELKPGVGGAKLAPENLISPEHGMMRIQDKKYGFIVDRPDHADYALYIDWKQNGIYTDADRVPLGPMPENSGSMSPSYQGYRGSFQTDVVLAGQTSHVTYNVYLFDKHDPNKEDVRDSLYFYADFALQGQVSLGGVPFNFFVSDPTADATDPRDEWVKLLFDREHNGKYTRQDIYDGWEPFNLGTGSFKIAEISFKDGFIRFAKSSQKVKEDSPLKDVHTGDLAPSFKVSTTGQKVITFPQDYKGKLVLLYFWGSYFDKAVASIPDVVDAYSKYSNKGLAVLGFDFEYPATAKVGLDLIASKKMVWPTITDQELEGGIAPRYGVHGVPGFFLVDGSTGKILADNDELKGDGLPKVLAKFLGEH